MKKYLYLILNCLIISANAQVPQGIPYQAIARNGQGQPLASTNVKVRFSILDSTATGTAVYVESHTTTTSVLGLFTANVGMGTASTGTFSAINWGQNFKFLKVELDTTATGNSYIDLGTQQMMSVPYALYAGNVSQINLHKPWLMPGIFYGGGIIGYVLKPGDFGYIEGETHGLIISPYNLGQAYWGCAGVTVGSTLSILGSGNSNTVAITNLCGSSCAAGLCYNLILNGFSDWYLPSYDELDLIYQTGVLGFTNNNYWTSTEYNFIQSYEARVINMSYGIGGAGASLLCCQGTGKNAGHYVRAVRSF